MERRTFTLSRDKAIEKQREFALRQPPAVRARARPGRGVRRRHLHRDRRDPSPQRCWSPGSGASPLTAKELEGAVRLPVRRPGRCAVAPPGPARHRGQRGPAASPACPAHRERRRGERHPRWTSMPAARAPSASPASSIAGTYLFVEFGGGWFSPVRHQLPDGRAGAGRGALPVHPGADPAQRQRPVRLARLPPHRDLRSADRKQEHFDDEPAPRGGRASTASDRGPPPASGWWWGGCGSAPCRWTTWRIGRWWASSATTISARPPTSPTSSRTTASSRCCTRSSRWPPACSCKSEGRSRYRPPPLPPIPKVVEADDADVAPRGPEPEPLPDPLPMLAPADPPSSRP